MDTASKQADVVREEEMSAEARALAERRNALLKELDEVEGRLRGLLSPNQFRDVSMEAAGLRGSVVHYGDIVSPIDVVWDAER